MAWLLGSVILSVKKIDPQSLKIGGPFPCQPAHCSRLPYNGRNNQRAVSLAFIDATIDHYYNAPVK
jgi:hypothetical protein